MRKKPIRAANKLKRLNGFMLLERGESYHFNYDRGNKMNVKNRTYLIAQLLQALDPQD